MLSLGETRDNSATASIRKLRDDKAFQLAWSFLFLAIVSGVFGPQAPLVICAGLSLVIAVGATVEIEVN